jgi:hypothetical protein
MGWWSRFDRGEVAADFERIAASGLDSVRVFLTWEDFQPSPETVDREMLGRLVAVADLGAELGLALIPTLFTGHMSAVNWIPAWAFGGPAADDRFRVISRGAIAEVGLRNWYSDPAVAVAQALLAARPPRRRTHGSPASPRRSEMRTRRRRSPSCPRRVTSCRCTAIRSTHAGPAVPPTSTFGLWRVDGSAKTVGRRPGSVRRRRTLRQR